MALSTLLYGGFDMLYLDTTDDVVLLYYDEFFGKKAGRYRED